MTLTQPNDVFDEANGLTIEETCEVESIGADTKVDVILSDARRKNDVEDLAWRALNSKLQTQMRVCGRCKGKGDKNGDECVPCEGTGQVEVPPSDRMVEMVLAPKFPKTAINVNADLENATSEDVLKMIEAF